MCFLHIRNFLFLICSKHENFLIFYYNNSFLERSYGLQNRVHLTMQGSNPQWNPMLCCWEVRAIGILVHLCRYHLHMMFIERQLAPVFDGVLLKRNANQFDTCCLAFMVPFGKGSQGLNALNKTCWLKLYKLCLYVNVCWLLWCSAILRCYYALVNQVL